MNHEQSDTDWAEIFLTLASEKQSGDVSDDEDDELMLDTMSARYHSLLDFQGTPFDLDTSQLRSESGKPVDEYWAAVNMARTQSLLARADASGLCAACSSIDLRSRYPVSHHQFHKLHSSASQGCSVCLFFSKNVTADFSTRSTEISVNLAGYSLEYKVLSGSGGHRAVFELFSKQEGSSDLLQNAIFRDVSPDPVSSERLQLIRSWLENCHTNHHRCTRAPDYFLPTRVIDVRGQVLRLRELKSRNIPYVTLSHCWGSNTTMTTLKSNLRSHKRCMDSSKLPQTFRDAVIITKKLGISYLWIDSLCILQDSKEDWMKECQKMGTYYRNSYTTISAIDSSDSNRGFLKPRSSNDAVEVPNTGVWMRRKFPSQQEVFRKAVLNHRGWFLQERLLSTCILHFAKEEIFWECQSCSAKESSFIEHDLQTDYRSLVSSEGEDFKRSLCSVNSEKFSHEEAYEVWMRLVRQFSLRSLTYSSDRLPAISSLAALIATKTNSSYTAGLWNDDLHGLAWFSDGPNERIRHQSSNSHRSGVAIPSWSWAKMKNSITYRFDDAERVTTTKDPNLISAHTTALGPDPFGSVSGGFVTLQALTKPVQCIDLQKELLPGGRTLDPSLEQYIFSYSERRYAPLCSLYGLTLYICGEEGKVVGTGSFDEDRRVNTVYQCKAVRIAERCYERLGGEWNCPSRKKENIIYFLLVQPDPHDPGSWRRVGIGLTRNFDYHEYYKDFFDLWEWEELRLT